MDTLQHGQQSFLQLRRNAPLKDDALTGAGLLCHVTTADKITSSCLWSPEGSPSEEWKDARRGDKDAGRGCKDKRQGCKERTQEQETSTRGEETRIHEKLNGQ